MAQSFSLEEALGGASESASTPAVGFSLEEALGLPAAPTGPQAPGPTPGLVSFINEPKKPEEKKVFTGSVFDTQPFEPEFDPAEAARLSRRAYAEETTRAPRRVQEMRATPEEQLQRSALRAAGDTAIGVLQGAAAIPKGITDNIPFDNPLSQFYKDAYEAGEKSKSGYLRSKNVERAALLDNIRRNQGELAATRGAFTTMFSPAGADIVAQGAGSMIPALGMSVLNLGTKSMMAMNALANAGDAAQQTAARLADMSPEDWSKSSAYQALREQGMDHRDAVRMLAPMYALPSQVIGGITGAVSGGTGLESALVKGAAKSARARAGRAGVELLGEEAETLAPMLAGNVTQRIIDDRTALLGGLGQAAVETAAAAGPGAGLAAAISAPERRAQPSAERMARERGFLVETPKAEPVAPTEERAAPAPFTIEEAIGAPAEPTPEKIVAPAEPTPVTPTAEPAVVTPAVERMQEQQRAVQELEAGSEIATEGVLAEPEIAPRKTALELAREQEPADKYDTPEMNLRVSDAFGQDFASMLLDETESYGRAAVRKKSLTNRVGDMRDTWAAASDAAMIAFAENDYSKFQPYEDLFKKTAAKLKKQLTQKPAEAKLTQTQPAASVLPDRFLHGTSPENKEAILESNKFAPVGKRQYSYSQFGRQAVYFSPAEGWWLNKEQAEGGRAAVYPDQLDVRLDPSARIATINSVDDLDNLAKSVGYADGLDLMRNLDVDNLDMEDYMRNAQSMSLKDFKQFYLNQFKRFAPAEIAAGIKTYEDMARVQNEEFGGNPVTAKELEAMATKAWNNAKKYDDSYQAADAATQKLLDAGIDGIYISKDFSSTVPEEGFGSYYPAPEQLAMFNTSKVKPVTPESWMAMRPGVAEEMEGKPAPLTEEAQAEVDRLTADQNAALADLEEMSKRTAGTSLIKVLKGTLNDGELSELGGRSRQVGKNPFMNLKASKGQRGSSMEDMVESGALDLFLPDDMRPGHPNYDNAESAEYIREKLRVGEFYTYETERAIAEVDKDIAYIERQIQELLSEDEINKEIQYAVNEQRELDQAAAEPATEEEAGVAEERAGEEEVLKPQTKEDLRAKAEREEAAAREEEKTRREEERKAAAPKAEEFVLTGSERAADEAAARGQMELAPAEEPAAKERPTNMYKALEQKGFKRLNKNDDRVYRDQDGKAYPTFEKNGARIAMTSNNILYENNRGDVEIGYGEPEDTVVHALLVDPATRGQGIASEVMDELGALADEYGVTLYLEPTAISDKPVPTMKLVKFYEGKGYEFDGDSSKVMVRQPSGQNFLNIEPVGESVAGDESTRAPSLKRKIKTLNRQREEGKISDQRFINEVDFAVKQDEEQKEKAAPRERVRGADFIRQKLLEAKRRGDLSAEGVDLAEWFILQNEALVDDLGIAIKTPKEGGTAGMYNKLARIMVLMKEASNDSTIVHEILHHLERMMPAEVQAAIRTEWLGSMLRASRQAKTPQEKMFFAALINHHFGSGFTSDITLQGADAGNVLDSLVKRGVIEGPRASSYQLAIEMIRSGMVPYDRYQYVNPSEFWAVRGSDIVEGRFKAIKGGVLTKLKNWLKELAQKIKSIFGLRSDAPLIKALDSLAKGDGKFVSKDMLGEGENFLQVGKNIYNRRPLAQWADPDETKLDDWIYKLVDKNVDTKRVIQSIEKSIGKLDDKWNPYLQEELYHGRTATQTKDFLKFEVRPLLQEMQKENVTIPEIEEYLHNRFAPIRNQNIAKINPEFPDDGTPGSGGSGIDTADAKAYMANLSPEQKAKYEKIAKMVDAITRNTRGYLVATGLEDVDTVMEWEKSSPDYVPLSRGDIDYGRSVGTGTGMGFSVRGPATRRATGSRRDVVNILANVITQREQAIVRGEKNRVATALYGLAVQNPNPEFWLAVNPDAPGAKKKAVQELVSQGMSQADAEGLMQEPSQKVVDESRNLVTSRVNPVLRSAENVLGVRVNGKDRFIYFNTQNPRAARMAQSLKNLDADQLGTALTAIAKITRYFASINTQYNPIFGVYNFLRDIQGGAIQISGTPLEGSRWEVLNPANLAGAMRGIYQTLRAERAGKQQLMTPWADLWIDFQREGGQTGFRDLFSRSQERAAALQSELDAMKEGKLKKAAYAVPRAIRDWLADYNETLENAVRLTAYKAALDKGMSREQAASVAKNLTVNFNRKGQIGVQAGALYAFFNSSMQGTSRLLQTIAKTEKPGDIKGLSLTSIGKKVVYGGLLLGVIQAMSMAAMGFDEDEPPDFVKDRNLIIPLPGGKYIAWPLPLGYHIIPAISRILTEWAISGGKDSGKRVAHLTSLIFDAFSPIGNAGWSLQSIAPTIFDPIAALFENRDWTGKKIAKEDFNKLDPTPGYTRAKQNASWFGKELSYFLNLASGGDKDKPGIVSPTPDQIDYLIGQAFGGLGREVMKASKTAEGLRTGEEIAPYNVPLVGRFYGDTKAGYAESNKFYKNLEEVNILENQLQGRQKRKEGAADFLKENPKVRLAPAAHSIERNIRQLRKQKEALVEKGAPKEQIKAIENRITLQMKKFNEKFENLDK